MSDDKIILEGVFTKFDNVNHGRFYPADEYLDKIETYKKRIKQNLRNKKIKRLYERQ